MFQPRRLTRRVIAVISCGALAAGALATGTVASAATASSQHRRPISAVRPVHAPRMPDFVPAGAPGGTVHYAVDTPVCSKPTAPDYYTCFAERRTNVARSTKGAYAYLTPATASGPNGGYTPGDLAGAYGYNPKAKVHQTVGIVDWFDDPSALSDLNTFDTHYGLPKETSSSFRKVNQNGAKAPLPARNADSSGEITLDVQSVRAVCQHCRILLVEAKGPTDADLAKAENEAVRLGATEVSNSYGSAERSHKISNATVEAYNHPGVVITASTGDEGWYGWDYEKRSGGTSQNSAIFPSTSPTVVAVGGTSVVIKNKKRAFEVVWNEDAFGNDGGTGGGCSQLFRAAPWQSTYANYAAAKCASGRLAADVSAIADPYTGFDVYQTYGGKGWETAGGTSLSSPVTAAMWALAGGAHGAAYPASTLYVNAKVHPSSLYDVVPYQPTRYPSGNSVCSGIQPNTCDSDEHGNPNGFGRGLLDCSLPRDGSEPTTTVVASRECNVAKGLDGPTGLGTPRSLRLFESTTPSIRVTAPRTIRKGRKATYHAIAKEIVPQTKVTEYVIIWGDGKTTTTKTGRASHTYKKAGTHILTVLVLDSRHQETFKRFRVSVKK